MAALLTVVAGMKAKPGKEEDLRRAVLALKDQKMAPRCILSTTWESKMEIPVG